MTINKRNLTPIALVSIFLLMLGLSFAAVPLYDLFCRVTGFGGTTQNASEKEIPKIIVNQDYKLRFDTNVHSTSDWKFFPEKNTIDLKPGEVHTVKFNVENPSNQTSSGSASFNVSPSSFGKYLNKIGCFCFEKQIRIQNDFCDTSSRQPFSKHGLHAHADGSNCRPSSHGQPLRCTL